MRSCFFSRCTALPSSGKDVDDVDNNVSVSAKTQFLRNMAHRIDTDMIRRLTRSSTKLREISDQTSIPDFVATIFDVGEEYGQVLENVLRYYATVNGTFKTIEGPMLIRNVVSDAKMDAKRHMLRVSREKPLIDVSISFGVPVSEMISDGLVIKECLQELIFNGLRHDERTHVSVTVVAMSHNPCHVTFAVENKGFPIQDKDLPHMFTPFHSIHRGIVHGAGLGIGLAKCKQMAIALGGDLHVSNGEITTFSLTVPIRHEKPLQLQADGIQLKYQRRPSDFRNEVDVTDEAYIFPSEPVANEAVKPRVLVVDDSAIARRQFQKMLKYLDIDVDLCDGPLKCLEMVEQGVYDVICLDILMPVMSGITCAYNLREGRSCNKDTPLVIITADSSLETREMCAHITRTTVLQKPAKRNVLFRTIVSSITRTSRKEWMRKTWHEKNTLSEDDVVSV